jgi:hypothetical protein
MFFVWLDAILPACERIKMKFLKTTCVAAMLCLLSGANSAFSQVAPGANQCPRRSDGEAAL